MRHLRVVCVISAVMGIGLLVYVSYKGYEKCPPINLSFQNQDKHINEDGIYPLPERPKYKVERSSDSVIPQKFFRKKPGVSSHNYKWILNPYKACGEDEKEPPFLLVTIASASWEFERRELIRQTWASVRQPFGKYVQYLFFVAKDPQSNNKLRKEFEKYNDLIQEDFNETYKNLTIKTQGQLKWATYFCPNARFIMHVDDDVFVDIKEIVKHLSSQAKRRILHCAKVFMPQVRRDGKWEMNVKEYNGSKYPLSCVGWCFVMSKDVVSDLYFTSVDTHLIHLEDVTFTGILRERIGNLQLKKIPNGESLCQHKGWPKDRPTNDKLLEAWTQLKNQWWKR
ncbi:beta-1,3-galactosyltransferase 1-like isoform X2 [Clavelina lepadiformis]|uniref:beta-1,3-galactosyltransferase 1-like isoform X2 n=1 Tax=Clavelina lepadiformis TaxID=159417 RepID=UPI0040412970